MFRLARLVAFAAIAGCHLPGPVADRSTFYDLTPTVARDGAAPQVVDIAVGLGPVIIPGYLDRPQLVTRIGPNELRLAPEARWAEPLREGIVRTLRQDLLVASGARSVTPYPWSLATHVDYVVIVDVLRFESDDKGGVELLARWSVREVPGGRVVDARESRLTESADGAGTGGQVAALSRTLGGLAEEIATALRAVKPATGKR